MFTLTYETRDVVLTEQFNTAEALTKFVKSNIAHDLNTVALELKEDNWVCDVQEFVQKVAQLNNGMPVINDFSTQEDTLNNFMEN